MFVLLVTPLSVYLLSQNQNPQSRASSSTGTAIMTMAPTSATVAVGSTQKVSLYFNTAGEAIQIVSMRVTYPYSGSSPEVAAQNLVIDPTFLVNGNGDWTCSVQSIATTSPNVNVDISCVNTNVSGFISNADTLIATFEVKANSVPAQNPVTISFDETNSHIRRKSDNSDVLLTPTSHLVLSVSGSNSPPPPPAVETHKACFNSSCAVFAGPGSDECTTVGASCTQQFSPQAVSGCNGKFDPNCYNCANDDEINVLDFACFRAAFGERRGSGINWQ